MINKEIKIVKEYFNYIVCSSKTIAIVTHTNPDGDGLSACIALYHILNKIYKIKTEIIMDSIFPNNLKFLKPEECIINPYDENKFFDTLIILDCNEPERLDTNKKIFSKAKNIFIIDHHIIKNETINNDYFYFIDENAVSTGIMLHRFLDNVIQGFNQNDKRLYANCIYTTILNDTNNFVNKNTNQECFTLAGELTNYGLNPAEIVYQFLLKTNLNYLKFIGQSMSTLALSTSQKIAYFYSTLTMLKENNLTTQAYSKMMKWTKGIANIEIQVSFQEYRENEFRVSLRSETKDVAKIAQKYSGGGHKEAAGFKINGTLQTVIKTVINDIESFIK